MGCRTRANEYVRAETLRRQQMGLMAYEQVQGNVVRKSKADHIQKTVVRRRAVQTLTKAEKEAISRQKRKLVISGLAAAAVVIGMGILLIAVIDKENTYSSKITSLESQIQKLSNQNDAREYEIDSSVDLDDVITRATEELGMVRSNASQIRTYTAKESEYLQQVAEVPVK